MTKTAHKIKVVQRAKRFLTEDGWCQRALARNDEGVAISAFNVHAEEYCFAGALACAAWVSEVRTIPMKQEQIDQAIDTTDEILKDFSMDREQATIFTDAPNTPNLSLIHI